MFDIGWGELLLIGIVALVVIGPKELPAVLRSVGQWTAKLRRMASEFQQQFQEAMREAEVADLKKQVDDITSDVRSYSHFDPISDVRRELEKTHSQIENAMKENPSTEQVDAPSAPADAASAAVSTAEASTSIAPNPAAAPMPPADAPAGSGDGKQAAEGKPT